MFSRILPAAALALLLAFPAWAAETFTLLAETTFTDFTTDPTSGTENNPSGLAGAEFIVEYTQLVPDRKTGAADYKIYAVVEAQAPSGNWFPIAQDITGVNNSDDGLQRIIFVHPSVVNSGESITFATGTSVFAKKSFSKQSLPSAFRVRFDIDQGTIAPLTSFTVVVTGSRFD